MTTKLLAVGAIGTLVMCWRWVSSDHLPAFSEPARPKMNVTDTYIVEVSESGTALASVRDGSDMPTLLAPADDAAVLVARNIAGVFSAWAIERLTTEGLSLEDSERIVGDAARDVAMCQLDAVRAQAAEQLVPFEVVLDSLLAQSSPNAIGLPDVLDSGAVLERVAPCMLTAEQRVGLTGGSPSFFTTGKPLPSCPMSRDSHASTNENEHVAAIAVVSTEKPGVNGCSEGGSVVGSVGAVPDTVSASYTDR